MSFNSLLSLCFGVRTSRESKRIEYRWSISFLIWQIRKTVTFRTEWMDEWTNKWVNEWMNEWISSLVNGRTTEWQNQNIHTVDTDLHLMKRCHHRTRHFEAHKDRQCKTGVVTCSLAKFKLEARLIKNGISSQTLHYVISVMLIQKNCYYKREKFTFTYIKIFFGPTGGLSSITTIPCLSVSSRSSFGGGCLVVRMALAPNHFIRLKSRTKVT